MAAEIRCAACGGEIAADLQFCVRCGARQPPSCASCGTALVEGAAFCGSCGAAVSAAAPEAMAPAAPTEAAAAETTAPLTGAAGPAPPAAPAACGQCGEPLREGARFCRKCGAPAVPGAGSPRRVARAPGAPPPQAVSAPAIIDQLTWSSAAAGLGLIIALISPFLSWASAGGISVGALGNGGR